MQKQDAAPGGKKRGAWSKIQGADVGCRLQMWDAGGSSGMVINHLKQRKVAETLPRLVFRGKFGVFSLPSVFWELATQQVGFLQEYFYPLNCLHQLSISRRANIKERNREDRAILSENTQI